MKTPPQIAAEIARLMALKPRVPKHTMFGDSNHEQIDAQLEVLESRMSDDAIFDRGDEEKAGEEEAWSEAVVSAALEASRWLREENEPPPSASWEGLAK